MNKTEKKLKFERLMEIRKKYEQFVEADRRRKERNELIIDKLHNIKNNWLSMRCKYPSIRDSDSQINYSGKTRVDLLAELGKSQNRTQALLEPVTNFGERGFQNLILTELSKHYILIPKQKHSNFDHAQNENNAESYLVPSKQPAEDWKSKYDVLKNLENNELKSDYKQTSDTRKNNIVDNDIDITYSDPSDNSLQSTRITTARIFDNAKSDHHQNDVTKLEFFPESQFHRENAMREISNSIDYNENNNNDRRMSGNKKMEYYAASQIQQNIMPRMKSHDDDIQKIIDGENKDDYDTVVVPPFRIESMQHYVNSAQNLPQHYEIPHEQQNSLHQSYYVQPHQYFLPPLLPHKSLPEQHGGGGGAQDQDFSSTRMPSSTNIQSDVHNISSQQMPNSISNSNTELEEYNEEENVEQQNIEYLSYENDSSNIKLNEKEFENSTEDTNTDKKMLLHTHNGIISDESIAYVNTMSEVLLNTNIKSDSDKPNPISYDEKDVKINIDHKNGDNTETKQFTDEEPEKEHPSKQSEEKFNPQNESTSDVNQDIIHPVNYIVGQDEFGVQEYSHEQPNYQNLEADLDQDLNQTYDPNYHEQYAPVFTDKQYEQNEFEQNQYVSNQSELYPNEQNEDDQNQYEQTQVGQYQYEQNQVEQSQYEQSQSELDHTAQNQEGQYQNEQNQVEQSKYEQSQSELDHTAQNQEGQYQYEQNQVEQSQYEQSQSELDHTAQIQEGQYQYEQNQVEQSKYEQSQSELDHTAQNQEGQYQNEQNQVEQSKYEQSQSELDHTAQNQEGQYQYEQNQVEQSQYEQSQSELDHTAQNQEGQYQYEQNQEEQYQYQNNTQNEDGQNLYEQNQAEHYQYDEHQIAQYQYEQNQNEQYPSEQNQYEPIQLAPNQDKSKSQYEQNQYEQTQQHNIYVEQQDPIIEGGLYEELHDAYTAQMNSDSTVEDKLYEELHGAYTAQMNLTPQDGHDGQIINQPHNKALLEKAGFEPKAHGDDARKQLQYQQQGDYVNKQDTHELRPEHTATKTLPPQKDGEL